MNKKWPSKRAESLQQNILDISYFKLYIILDQKSKFESFTPSGCKDMG